MIPHLYRVISYMRMIILDNQTTLHLRLVRIILKLSVGDR